jgi:hypothetical protein
VIKRIWLLAATPPSGLVDVLSAPGTACPLRATIATVLRDLTPQAPYDAVGLAWFRDAEHLDRFDRWHDGRSADPVTRSVPVDPATIASVTIAATEQVKRGYEWLNGHWDRGGCAFKHMALARRAAGLSREDFSARWSAHAGRIGATAIPEPVKGVAYVQNHPLATAHDGEPPYDAVNEVYFTDLDGLRTRVSWFAEQAADRGAGAGGGDDLIAENWFLAVHEELVTP